jgi:hypothetical protein
MVTNIKTFAQYVLAHINDHTPSSLTSHACGCHAVQVPIIKARVLTDLLDTPGGMFSSTASGSFPSVGRGSPAGRSPHSKRGRGSRPSIAVDISIGAWNGAEAVTLMQVRAGDDRVHQHVISACQRHKLGQKKKAAPTSSGVRSAVRIQRHQHHI